MKFLSCLTTLVLAQVSISTFAEAAPKKKRKANPPAESASINEAESSDAVAAEASPGSGVIFPDWSPDGFDWSLGPILGARARKTEILGVEYDSLISEIGLGTRIQGIPLIPGNPGITVEPYATYTWGNRTQKQKGAEIDETDSSGFQRHWYGLVGRLYYKFFRYSLDIGMGQIQFDDKQYDDLTGTRFANDFGLMILPHFSTHYTITSYKLKVGDYSTPAIDEFDHWLHARFSFSLFKTSLDLGPGWTTTEYAGLVPSGQFQKLADVETSYWKALASMHIFWKLGLTGYAKLITDADDATAVNDKIDQLPNENLAQSRSLAFLPKDSIEASLFFGLRDIIGGFGFGWQIYYLELKQEAGRKQISRDSGLVFSYDAGF